MQALSDQQFVVQARPMDGHRWVKRALDLTVAVLLLVCLAPVLLLCALVIVLESRGPVVYRQTRVGEGGKTFSMLKLRSMCNAADVGAHVDYAVAYIHGTALSQVSAGQTLYKLANDKRVTRVGRVLRKTSLDELPQLWNVVRGDMSLVGPRPALPYEVEQYEPRHRERLNVRPGITGLWQVSGRCRTTFEEMVALDCEYIRRQSLALDLLILVKTFPVVVFCTGAR
jgi:lipopolysaccharide/colanic/teichoic acid biosynthesis glycosyltransferase